MAARSHRHSDELREEERIVVYRKLIQEMLRRRPMPDDRTRHVVAEVINSMFDVDKMLYFVAPEWWRPRLHRSQQQLPERNAPAEGLRCSTNGVLGCGRRFAAIGTSAGTEPAALEHGRLGRHRRRDQRDNYFITDETRAGEVGQLARLAAPARRRQHAERLPERPWVKAVIPIRPGRRRPRSTG